MTRTSLIYALMKNADISEAEADLVVRHYVKIKVLTFNVHDGFRMKHGAFFDRDVIERTLESAMP